MPSLIFQKSALKWYKRSQIQKEKENLPQEINGQKHIIYKNFSYIWNFLKDVLSALIKMEELCFTIKFLSSCFCP